MRCWWVPRRKRNHTGAQDKDVAILFLMVFLLFQALQVQTQKSNVSRVNLIQGRVVEVSVNDV